jgi:hypothetical protein
VRSEEQGAKSRGVKILQKIRVKVKGLSPKNVSAF